MSEKKRVPSSEPYYVGLDVGTNSVGWAVTSPTYHLLRHKGEPMWGSALFEEGETKAGRRAFRTGRRRLARRQWRVRLVQYLFASAVASVDPLFYRRLKESALWRDEAFSPYTVFHDPDFTDVIYHRRYPTIHHLICDLMTSDEPHDVRLVYLACAWLVAHRGHFLSQMSEDAAGAGTDFSDVFAKLQNVFENMGQPFPWKVDQAETLASRLPKNERKSDKERALKAILLPKETGDLPKETGDDPDAIDGAAMIKLAVGGKVAMKALFPNNEAFADGEIKLCFADAEETVEATLAEIDAAGGNLDLLFALRGLYDWSLLTGLLGENDTISAAKVKIYEQHKADLAFLKAFLRRHAPQEYHAFFRRVEKDKITYASYTGHIKSTVNPKDEAGPADKEALAKRLKALLSSLLPDQEEEAAYDDALARLDTGHFLPKQVDTDNRVIPYQLYYAEMKALLAKASAYLPFLTERDEEGLSVTDKLLSVMKFRVPYFVGPLHEKSGAAWLTRQPGAITPWNFQQKVDLDQSEQDFIDRMTNQCTYLPTEEVLPKASLLHQRFQVLNELNVITINGHRIAPEAKKALMTGLFEKKRKVSVKDIKNYLEANNFYKKSDLDTLEGLDITFKSSLSSYYAFRRLLETGTLSTEEVEDIIRRATYSEDKNRFVRWLNAHFSKLSAEDLTYIGKLSFKDFARLSGKLLTGIEGTDKATGEVFSILAAMEEKSVNLMELLSDAYTFREKIDAFNRDAGAKKAVSLSERLDDMRLSGAVKRPILRALTILEEITKIQGKAPDKIFIEMARGGSEEQKKRGRIDSRTQNLRALYTKVGAEDARIALEMTRKLDQLGDEADTRLQSDRIYLYYLQLGRCMYSGEPIDYEKLIAKDDKTYDIEHIYPRALVKDDSIINNLVLVKSTLNGAKSDTYPVPADTRHKMTSYWRHLKDLGLCSEEKFKRLTRSEPFSPEEQWGFINRQMTETQWATKQLAALIQERYPETEVGYVKAALASEFRQLHWEEGFAKSRTVNDLHHAKDAYLNIVMGNVWHSTFTRAWFDRRGEEKCSIKTETLFGYPRKDYSTGAPVWDPARDFLTVRKAMTCPHAHLTVQAYSRTSGQSGGFFDQMPVKAQKGLTPRKTGLDPERYGGYNNTTATYFALASMTLKKKKEVMILPIELLARERFEKDPVFALAYLKETAESIVGQIVSDFALPLGRRPLKINTVLSLDGFYAAIGGKDSGGKMVIIKPLLPLILSPEQQAYVKRLESFTDKKKKNPRIQFQEQFDKIDKGKNQALFDHLLQKLKTRPYALRPSNPAEKVEADREKFASLTAEAQIPVLLGMVTLFGRAAKLSKEVDFGSDKCRLSAKLSNWKYDDIRIVDSSVTGLFEKVSCNLKDFLS